MGDDTKDSTVPKGKPDQGVAKSTLDRVIPVTITATKPEYIVVLDDIGAVPTTYPLIDFSISGPPDWFFEVQVARKEFTGLLGGPGLTGSWDSSKGPLDRIPQATFSSWTNGQKTLKLDGKGNAKYTMPLDWWKDQARQQLKDFTNTAYFFRALAFKDSSGSSPRFSTPDKKTPSTVHLLNNLVSFQVKEKDFDYKNVKKVVELRVKVRVADTLTMYCVVQWNKGEIKAKNRSGDVHFETATDYGISHDADFPEWTIDRLVTDPRFGYNRADGLAREKLPEISLSGIETDEQDHKLGLLWDTPGGKMTDGQMVDFYNMDFKDKLHLNCDVAGKKVNIIKKTGSEPIYGQVIGVLPDPQPAILHEISWKVRILQSRSASERVNITHPDTFVVR